MFLDLYDHQLRFIILIYNITKHIPMAFFYVMACRITEVIKYNQLIFLCMNI